MSLPIHSPPTTPRPTTLAQAVAQSRHPRNHATAQLEPHREELLRLAEAGDSAETLAIGLGLIGIKIGRETMRRWLQRERRRRRPKASAGASAGDLPTVLPIPASTVETAPMPKPEIPPAGHGPRIARDDF